MNEALQGMNVTVVQQLNKERTILQEFSSDQAPVWKVETAF